MAKWPVTPIDYLYKWILKNRSRFRDTRLLDNGCGKALLAQKFMKNPEAVLTPSKDSDPVKPEFKLFKDIVSMDLVSSAPFVLKGNMNCLPFKDSEINNVVFSLSLMNTNYAGFLQEAIRVLASKSYIIISKILRYLYYLLTVSFKSLIRLKTSFA